MSVSHRISVGGLPSADCVASSLVTPGSVFALGLQYDQLLTDSLHLANRSVSRPADPRRLVGNTQASQGCRAAWCHSIETHCKDEQGVARTFRSILNLRWLGWQSTVVSTMIAIRVSGHRELLCPKPSLSMGACGVRVSQSLSPSLVAAFGGRLTPLTGGISASLIAERFTECLLHARRGCDISAPSVSRADGD